MQLQKRRMWISFWCVLLASVIVVTICGAYMAIMINRQKEEIERRVTNAAIQNQDFMVERLSNDVWALQAIAIMLEQQPDLSPDTLMPYLRAIADQYSFDHIGYVGRDGVGYQIGRTSSEYHWFDVSQSQPFHQAMMKRGGIEILQNGEEQLYSIMVPICRDGEANGAVYMTTSTERLANMINAYSPGKDAFSCIVLEDGEILYSSNSEIQGKDIPKTLSELQIQNEELMEKLQREDSVVVDCKVNGEDYWACCLPLSIKRWRMICLIPQTQTFGETSIVQISFIASGAIALFLILMFLYYFFMMRRSFDEVKQLAYFDKLTGAYNRDYFQIKAAAALRQGEDLYALMLIDLQNFKFINELFGFSEGNELLLYVKRVLEKHVRAGEVFFRDTADRFGALIAYEEYGELRKRIHQILDEVSAYSFESGEQCYIACRCGVQLLDSDGVEHIDISQEINHALIALEEAKECEGNRVIYYNDWLYRKSKRRHVIETKMESALENGQFHVCLQPKFALSTRQVAGAEALVRWKDVNGETVCSPEEFIPIMEQNGFIARLDRYVLREVCRIMDSWRKQGLEICPVSVNQSRRLLYQADYVASLRDILKEWEIPPGKVVLEITESVAMEDTELLKQVVDALHQEGFLISMDDFGSGYSSLNILKDIPVDELKLDRVFFEKTDRQTRQNTVIRSVISLARNLRITTVAEGVESAEQEKFLCKIGCDMAQSFYFAGCMPVDQFTRLLSREQE